jgi:RHS repeat-associated protein
LGSTIRATDAYNQVSGQQGYDAFGGKRRSSGELPTDYLYTGQEEDSGTGLLYYNARYYDPQLGQFLSPDTIVPEPTSFLDYNRYLYARGNPVIFNDPSGHETSKPEWWPPFLIYPFDLPDSSATEDVRTWFSENNVPTIVAYNVGGDVGAGIILGASASFEVQGSFNIWSGELALTRSTSFATRIGTPQASVNIHRGGTVVAGASSTQASFLGASRNITLDADVEMGGQVSGFGTWSQAVQYEDRNGNANFDLLDENGFSEPVYLGQPYIDPEFNRTVDALSIGTGAGLDLASIPLLPMRVGPIKWR